MPEITQVAAGTPVYPAAIDTDATLGPTAAIVPNSTTLAVGDQLGITKNLINTIIALETLVGITNSPVTTSHEFRIRKLPFKIFQAGLEYSAPATLYAVYGMQNSRPHLAFNDSSTTGAYFFGTIPLGAVLSGGLTVRLKWKSISTAAGNCLWGIQFERLNTAESADSFDAQVLAAPAACSTTQSALVETPISLTTIDGLTPGDGFGLLVQRLGGDPTDTMTGDACLRLVSVESTT